MDTGFAQLQRDVVSKVDTAIKSIEMNITLGNFKNKRSENRYRRMAELLMAWKDTYGSADSEDAVAEGVVILNNILSEFG